jgi:cytidyltransferase-like protein
MAVYTVGKFQPPTIGHVTMLRRVVAEAERRGVPAFVFVSSTRDKPDKTPLTSGQKVAYMRKMFPSGLNIVDTEECKKKGTPCGGPPAAHAYLVNVVGVKGEITIVVGSDRAIEFGPGADMWKKLRETGGIPPSIVSISRDETDKSVALDPTKMSGTKARGFAAAGDIGNFIKAVMYGSATEKDALELYNQVRVGMKMAGGAEPDKDPYEDISAFSADSDGSVGGTRKKKRRQRKTRRRRITRNKA